MCDKKLKLARTIAPMEVSSSLATEENWSAILDDDDKEDRRKLVVPLRSMRSGSSNGKAEALAAGAGSDGALGSRMDMNTGEHGRGEKQEHKSNALTTPQCSNRSPSTIRGMKRRRRRRRAAAHSNW
jgi:hypothetical protein